MAHFSHIKLASFSFSLLSISKSMNCIRTCLLFTIYTITVAYAVRRILYTYVLYYLLARDLARWLVWLSGAYSPHRPKAAGMRPVASGPHGPPPAPMPRRRSSPPPRRGNTSSATAAGGETSNRHYGRRWEKRRAGRRAHADTCRSLSCFPWKSATKR